MKIFIIKFLHTSTSIIYIIIIYLFTLSSSCWKVFIICEKCMICFSVFKKDNKTRNCHSWTKKCLFPQFCLFNRECDRRFKAFFHIKIIINSFFKTFKIFWMINKFKTHILCCRHLREEKILFLQVNTFIRI